MVVVELDPVVAVGEDFGDGALEFEKLFLRHALSFASAVAGRRGPLGGFMPATVRCRRRAPVVARRPSCALAAAWLAAAPCAGAVAAARRLRVPGVVVRAFALAGRDGRSPPATGDLLADQPLDAAQERQLVGRAPARSRCRPCPGARRAADAVDVGLGDVGQVEIDDVADAVDVDAAGGDVGRDQRADLAVRGTPPARARAGPASCCRGSPRRRCRP